MKRILVIDDDPSIARAIEIVLKAADVEHVLDYCSDGAQGRLKAAQGRYDLITLDLNMPLMGGVEALRELKRDPRSADIPVVVITAQHDDAYHRRVMKLGAAALVTKPFHAEALGSILSQVVSGEQVELPASREGDPDVRPLGG